MKKRKLKRNVKFFIIESLFIIIFLVALINIIIWYVNNNKTHEILESVQNSIEIKEDVPNDVVEEKYTIDFSYLKSNNSDTVAWIIVNGTNINYPVVKASDNNYYLTHSFDKSYNKAGWVFANFLNNFDGFDKNITLFAHARGDGTMFGTLKNVLTNKWQENIDNHQIILATENETNIYEVFATYKIEVEDYYIKSSFQSNDEYLEFLNTLKKRSNYDYGVNLDENDSILTLSTCYSNNNYRIVLHAKKVDNTNELENDFDN